MTRRITSSVTLFFKDCVVLGAVLSALYLYFVFEADSVLKNA